jgi:hypothetical protein
MFYGLDDDLSQYVAQILLTMTELNTLILHTAFLRGRFPFGPATIAVFSLPSLRRVDLWGYRFRNPFELQSLVTTSVSLRELKLVRIGFDGDEVSQDDPRNGYGIDQRVNNMSNGRALVLESLSLVDITPLNVELMMDSFTTVDIKHLKSLSFISSPITGLLRANAGSIQNVKIGPIFGTCESLAVSVPDLSNIFARRYSRKLQLSG